MGNKILELLRSWVQQALHATYSGYARGVSSLLNKSLAYKVLHIITDQREIHCSTVEIKAIVFAFIPLSFHQQLLYAIINWLP